MQESVGKHVRFQALKNPNGAGSLPSSLLPSSRATRERAIYQSSLATAPQSIDRFENLPRLHGTLDLVQDSTCPARLLPLHRQHEWEATRGPCCCTCGGRLRSGPSVEYLPPRESPRLAPSRIDTKRVDSQEAVQLRRSIHPVLAAGAAWCGPIRGKV